MLPKNKQKKGKDQAKLYTPPKVTAYGPIEKITGWTDRPRGGVLGDIASGWNPWRNPTCS